MALNRKTRNGWKTGSGMKKKKSGSQADAADILHIHIFSHTHWDFEWYEVEEGFKLQLIRLIDHLLKELERDPKFKFYFDGQVMPIEDYLEILQEQDNLDHKNRARAAERNISKFVQRGQLKIGPCWTTPETSIISTESLIRNINRGLRFSEKFGSASSVFYNADAFQYHSQVPQIIRGTGLKTAFTWRGSKEGMALKDLSLWKGADKTTVMRYYPARTYAQIWRLPEDPMHAMDMIKREAEQLRHFAVSKHVLITQGNDQFKAQSGLNETIKKAGDLIGDAYKVTPVALEEFFDIVKNEKLQVLPGELTGNKWACTLSGQLSARMYLKQKNERAEIAMEKWAEPAAAFSWLLGGEYPAGLLERAWAYLMKQHFHHCNACAVDDVHREGEVRYNSAIELAKDIADEGLTTIASQINSAAVIHKWESALVVFNAAGVERTGVVTAQINTEMIARKHEDWQSDKKNKQGKHGTIDDLGLWDESGEKVPYQVLGKDEDHYEIAFWADQIPPFGYKTFGLDFSGAQNNAREGRIADEKEHVMENEMVKVTVHENGVFTILDKRNNALFKDLNLIENSADHGDTYNFDPLPGDRPITTRDAKGRISIKANGPLLATLQVKTELNLPEDLSSDRKRRSGRIIRLPIFVDITLLKGSPLVLVKTAVDNRVKDHRLRALFPGVKSDVVHVETQSDVVKRRVKRFKKHAESKKRDAAHHTSIGALPKELGPSPTQFQRGFVGISNNEKGLVVFNRGLPEYEAKTDGTLALTLLRCVGWLSQDDLTTRTRLAGPKIAVPDAQCLGPQSFEYAVLPLAGAWETTPVSTIQRQYSTSTKFLQIPWQEGPLPTRLNFVDVSPGEISVTAVKKAYGDSTLIIRFYNPTSKKIKAGMGIVTGIQTAWLSDLNEKKKRKIPVKKDGRVYVDVGPKKIMTVRIEPGKV
jgi:mannosylglycerate hydrolase